jgi:hypothetical protein
LAEKHKPIRMLWVAINGEQVNAGDDDDIGWQRSDG